MDRQQGATWIGDTGHGGADGVIFCRFGWVWCSLGLFSYAELDWAGGIGTHCLNLLGLF